MSNPVRQHYIPRSYLKNFAFQDGDKYFVDALMKKQPAKIIKLSTKDICLEKNLYTFPHNTPGDRFALEKFYAEEVDGEYSKVYDMLINPNITVIGKDDKLKILNTVLSLFFRTPHFLNNRLKSLDKLMDGFIDEYKDPEHEVTVRWKREREHKFKMRGIEESRDYIKQQYKSEFLIDHFADWQEFVAYKMTCGIQLITVPDEVPIITSDNPVLILALNGQINLENIFGHHNIIEVPLDRNRYLIIHPNSVAEGEQLTISRATRDKRFAAGVNLRIDDNAQLMLVGHQGDLQVHLDSQAALGADTLENTQALEDLKKKVRLFVSIS